MIELSTYLQAIDMPLRLFEDFARTAESPGKSGGADFLVQLRTFHEQQERARALVDAVIGFGRTTALAESTEFIESGALLASHLERMTKATGALLTSESQITSSGLRAGARAWEVIGQAAEALSIVGRMILDASHQDSSITRSVRLSAERPSPTGEA